MMARAGGRVVRAGPSPRSATAATGLLLVERCILHSRCAFCTRERRLELHFRVRSARLGARGRPPRPPPGPRQPSRGPWRRRLSKSVAKARIAPERQRRNVDIPRFFSPPIPARGAFATDSDTPRPGPPQEPHPHHSAAARLRHHDDPGPRTADPGEKGSLRADSGIRSSASGHSEIEARGKSMALLIAPPGRSLKFRSGVRVRAMTAGPRPRPASCGTGPQSHVALVKRARIRVVSPAPVRSSSWS